MNNRSASQILYFIIAVVSAIIFIMVGVTDVKDPTNDKGHLEFNDGSAIELRHINNYIDDRLEGIETKDTLTNTMRKEINCVVVNDKKINEISDAGSEYKVKIEIDVFGSIYMYAYFKKDETNEHFNSLKAGDKISFTSTNLNKIGFKKNSNNNSYYMKYITFKDVTLIEKEGN